MTTKKQPEPQAKFPGFVPEPIAELDEAAEEYRKAKEAHQETGEAVKTAADELAGRMAKHKISVYPIDKHNCAVLEQKTGVSIKKLQGLGLKSDQEE